MMVRWFVVCAVIFFLVSCAVPPYTKHFKIGTRVEPPIGCVEGVINGVDC